jgi:hypothetical protein
MFGLTALRVHTALLIDCHQVTAGMLIQKVSMAEKIRLLQEIKDYDLCDIYKGGGTGLLFNSQEVLLFMETPAMVETNQNSRL